MLLRKGLLLQVGMCEEFFLVFIGAKERGRDGYRHSGWSPVMKIFLWESQF